MEQEVSLQAKTEEGREKLLCDAVVLNAEVVYFRIWMKEWDWGRRHKRMWSPVYWIDLTGTFLCLILHGIPVVDWSPSLAMALKVRSRIILV